MEVFIPNKCIGRIKQKFSMTLPSFELYNEYNSIVYRIEGPASYMSSAKEAHFGVRRHFVFFICIQFECCFMRADLLKRRINSAGQHQPSMGSGAERV